MIAFPNIKINLGLSITEKRPDGYHNLETVFYPVALDLHIHTKVWAAKVHISAVSTYVLI